MRGNHYGVIIMLRRYNNKGFTLAEVLVTLGIIGIVAAMTMPTLISSTDARVRETQLKKAYSVLSQANQMMIAHSTYPYMEFVQPFLVEDTEEDPGDNSGSGVGTDEGESGDEGSEQPDIPVTPPEAEPEPPVPEEPEVTPETPDEPDMNDSTTKDLVDGLIDAILGLDFGTAIENFNKLKDMYGLTNWGEFLHDYAEQSGKELPGWLEGILGIGGDNNGNSSGNGNGNGNGNNGNNGNGRYGRNRSSYKMPYMQIFADMSETQSNDEENSNFIETKRRQLAALKEVLNDAHYCERYDKCNGSKPVEYQNLRGEIATIEAADFEYSALKTADGMYFWLGDINNPQRYFVDINGAKRPNKLGVDVFTFDIISKEAIQPELSGNCTKRGLPTDGEGYRGLGCAGYALIDRNPDTDDLKGYWDYMK